MKAPNLFLLITFLCFALAARTQNINIEEDEVFRPNEVAKIYVSIAPKAFDSLVAPENRSKDFYYKADVRFVNSVLDETREGVGLRLRGNTSRTHPKLSYKIDFREFGGKKFYNHKKFNLKAENNDPTLLREHISLSLYRKANVPAARSSHVELYVNSVYMGLYLNVEQIDDEFADTRFGNEGGNLFKCLWGSSLSKENEVVNNDIYELKTNETANDRSRLLALVKGLNESNKTIAFEALDTLIDIETAVRFLAVEALIGHWDGYAYNQNNYYLYDNPGDQKFKCIAYDADNTFGIDWVGRDWGERDLMDWARQGANRPLHSTLLSREIYKRMYVNTIHGLIKGAFSEDSLFKRFDQYQALLAPSVQRDTFYPKTFGFTYNDFNDGFEQKVANHAPYGLKPYVSRRIDKAMEQLPASTVSTQNIKHLEHIQLYPNPSRDFITVSGSEQLTEVLIYNFQGEKLMRMVSKGKQSNIDLSTFPKGCYIVKINTEKGSISKKLLLY